jgi:hypothetical protein
LISLLFGGGRTGHFIIVDVQCIFTPVVPVIPSVVQTD